MKTNIDGGERVVRTIVGIVIMAIGLYYVNVVSLVGFEITLTAVLGWSPLYRIFAIIIGTHRRTVSLR